MSISAYKRTIRETEGPRQIERRVLTRVTNRLEEHCEAFDGSDASPDRLALLSFGLRDALNENQRIWRAFRTDLSDPSNSLPPELRAALISISHWVDRQSGQAMGGKGNIRALVDVNRSIIAGLSGATRSADAATATVAPAREPVAAYAAWR